MKDDAILLTIYRIVLRYIIGLNRSAETITALREEMEKLTAPAPPTGWLVVPCSKCSLPMNIKRELLSYWQDCGIQCEKCSRPQL